MSSDEVRSIISGISGAVVQSGALNYFPPEPKSRLSAVFGDVLRGAGTILGSAASGITGIDPSFMELINKQIEVQQQLQLVSFYSNIERSKHETNMSAVRNIRAA